MKIKVGEYVRTIDGYIRKVTQVNEKGTYQAIAFGKYETDVDYKNSKCISEKKIAKHSPNIIDLIEVGDYVNGWKVFKTNKQSYLDYAVMVIDGAEDGTYVCEYEIKSIVTHEQFKGMEYEI